MNDQNPKFHLEINSFDECQRFVALILGAQNKQLARIEQKIDALASEMTPAEKAAVVARLNADFAKINAASATLEEVTTKLNSET